jgi:hypothetical protein
MDNKNEQKRANDFYCKKCVYLTSRKTNYLRHIQTKKHMDNDVDNNNEQKVASFICTYCNKTYMYYSGLLKHQKKCDQEKNAKKMLKNANCPFLCECGKLYKHNSSFSRHRINCLQANKCIISNTINTSDTSYTSDTNIEKLTSVVISMLEKNENLIDKITEIAKEPKIINNNQFNILNYLNNDCKEAMNLSDFINELPFSLDDLEIMGTKGYQQSMEDTFIKQLQIMDKTKRPIHCSDKKRKSFYIKENDIWEKNEDNSKIVNGFKKLSQKHLEILNAWTHYNKNWSFNERKQNFFNRSVQEVAKYNDIKQINKLICKLTCLTVK